MAGVSDLDTFAVARVPREGRACWTGFEELWPVAQAICETHPVATKVEMAIVPLDAVLAGDCRFVQFALAHTTACVHGEDLGATQPRLAPGRDTVFALPHVTKDLASLEQWLEEGAPWSKIGPWMGKRILRAALEWGIDEHGQYSRDLWPCYQAFAQVCPDGDADMRRLLAMTIDPPEDEAAWREALSAAAAWITP
ncbi:MAG: hypothetical protein EP330_09590 [Deltaproteobacteria bacterium]|nr:MAG: hypothetical protein EP330_09590 [Deltaproteobacteria bacterium]